MIDSDPLFVDAAGGDYHLTFTSPCRGSGDNAAVTETTDFEGDPRIAQGTVDMGADEFYRHLYYTGEATPGSPVELKLVDLPGASPVGFWIALDALETPIPGAYGDWYLLSPMVGPSLLPPIPADGVQVDSRFQRVRLSPFILRREALEARLSPATWQSLYTTPKLRS